MLRRIIYFFLLSFALYDIGFSFLQHLAEPLDGDMAWNIVPANDVKPILNDPFGLECILHNQTHPNPNRFFSHWAFNKYFNNCPPFLQKFTEPIDSVYLACAISKTIIQISLILLLSIAISGTTNLFKLDFIIAAVLVAPLFQANGYNSYMGIIDQSITYTFFYALPFTILLLYFTPLFIESFYHKQPHFKLVIKIFWIPLAVIICLSGPLNPGIVLIVSLLVLLANIRKNYLKADTSRGADLFLTALKMVTKSLWFYLLPICLFAIYSLYLGGYNSISVANKIPVSELYLRLPQGLVNQFTRKLGFPVLFIMIALNAVLIASKYKTDEGRKIIDLFKWIGIFALIYILLLPLGGYRPYRHNILRYDTILPITICIIFAFGISALYLIKKMSNLQRTWYVPMIIGVLLLFTINDDGLFDKNQCERKALKEIAESRDTLVRLNTNCTVLSWDTIY